MLVINANQEQMQVFGRLIEEMGAQVVWNGRFVIMGDRLILEGLVRSLFFHFDIQKVSVELAELPDDDGEELEIQEYPGLADLMFLKFGVFFNVLFSGSNLSAHAMQIWKTRHHICEKFCLPAGQKNGKRGCKC